MFEKLDVYCWFIECPLAQLARILDFRLRNDLIADGDILRQSLHLPIRTTQTLEAHEVSRTLLERLLDEDSLSRYSDEKSFTLLRSTMNNIRQLDPLARCSKNKHRYLTLPKMASDMLAVQASSVASESAFIDALNLLTPHPTTLCDETVHSHLLSQSWMRTI